MEAYRTLKQEEIENAELEEEARQQSDVTEQAIFRKGLRQQVLKSSLIQLLNHLFSAFRVSFVS